jgi:hypothetical protein
MHHQVHDEIDTAKLPRLPRPDRSAKKQFTDDLPQQRQSAGGILRTAVTITGDQHPARARFELIARARAQSAKAEATKMLSEKQEKLRSWKRTRRKIENFEEITTSQRLLPKLNKPARGMKLDFELCGR